MDKIVTTPMKIDFHIHSVYSKYKDEYGLVKDGQIENLSLLLEKLNDNGINMCSITDHDYFCYDLYKSLKSHEGENELKKVFPGVEFSVGFDDENGEIKPVHVICVFDDTNEEKVKNISNCIPFKNGTIEYGNNDQFFTEETFISILRKIDLNVITIAHQKNSVTSKKSQKSKNDVSSLGSVKFNELIMCEYFESLEFKSMKNGLYNNNYAIQKNKNYDQIRFVTGSDCHDWKVYPKHDSTEEDDINFCFTYLKCLPSFKGLAMAFSDTSRISTKDYLFLQRTKLLDNLSICIDGNDYQIPLSNGINAIIGDNSIGKSLLLHKLTNYRFLEGKPKIKEGYESYLKRFNIEVKSSLDDHLIHTFDYQGRIRERFDTDNQNNQEFLASKFPTDINNENYKQIILEKLEELYNMIQLKFDYDAAYKKLNNLVFVDTETEVKNISAKPISNNRTEITKYSKIKKYYDDIILAINKKHDFIYVDEELKILSEFLKVLNSYLSKYTSLYNKATEEYSLKESINFAIRDFNKEMSTWRTQNENTKAKFDNEDSVELASTIAELLSLKQQLKKYEFKDEKVTIQPEVLKYGQYLFIKQFKNCNSINKKYLESIITRILKKGEKLDSLNLTERKLREMIKDTHADVQKNSLQILKERANEIVDDDLQNVPLITLNGSDIYNKLSSGMNSSIYFDILASDTSEGIYVIDQPEDDISQSGIKNNIIKNFKDMSNYRQIIMITHNPQFVVNLDVDNVICITKEDDKISIHSGALEYCEGDTDILDIVAKNLDGGIESIRKRWKRYDKAIKTL